MVDENYNVFGKWIRIIVGQTIKIIVTFVEYYAKLFMPHAVSSAIKSYQVKRKKWTFQWDKAWKNIFSENLSANYFTCIVLLSADKFSKDHLFEDLN